MSKPASYPVTREKIKGQRRIFLECPELEHLWKAQGHEGKQTAWFVFSFLHVLPAGTACRRTRWEDQKSTLLQLPWRGAKSQPGQEESPKFTFRKGKVDWVWNLFPGSLSLTLSAEPGNGKWWKYTEDTVCLLSLSALMYLVLSWTETSQESEWTIGQTNELLGLGSEGLFLCPLKGYFCVQERVTSVSTEGLFLFLFLFPVQGYFCVQERVLSVLNKGLFLCPVPGYFCVQQVEMKQLPSVSSLPALCWQGSRPPSDTSISISLDLQSLHL